MTSSDLDLGKFLLGHWDMLSSRQHGPLSLRILMQPLVAAAYGIRAGFRHARAGQAPFGSLLITHPELRSALLREGWSDVRKVFLTAVTVDVIYELLVFHWIYPGQALIVATILAVLPYVLIRGPSNRLVQWWLRRTRKIVD